MKNTLNYSLTLALKCTFCSELAISPINNCSGGHIVCGICIETEKKCKICQQSLVPCYFAERLVRKYDVKTVCKNVKSGCKKSIPTTELKQHLKECEYRPIKCILIPSVNCKEQVHLREYPQHLIESHNGLEIFIQKGKFTNISSHFKVNKQHVRVRPPSLVLVDKVGGKVFLMYEIHMEFCVYWWVTMIGTSKEAEDYQYTLAYKSKDKVEFKWTLPVLPLQEYNDFPKALVSGHLATMSVNPLNKPCTYEGGDQNANPTWIFPWEMSIKVQEKRISEQGLENECINLPISSSLPFQYQGFLHKHIFGMPFAFWIPIIIWVYFKIVGFFKA